MHPPNSRRTSSVKLIIAAFLSTLPVFLQLSSPQPVKAHTIQPYYKEYRMLRGERIEDTFSFQNSENDPVNIQIFVSGYDARNEIIDSDIRILTSSETSRLTVAPGETVRIPYSVTVPSDIQSASYFNVIYARLEEAHGETANSVAVQLGLGMITLVHVFESEEQILGAFVENSSVNLHVERGIPFIRNTQLYYRYKNSSDYIFTPYGEAKIFDVDSGRLLTTLSINSSRKHIFPGESYEEKFEVDIWEISNILSRKKVVSRTHSLENPAFIESLLYFDGFPQLSLIAVTVLLLIPLGILYLKRRRKK